MTEEIQGRQAEHIIKDLLKNRTLLSVSVSGMRTGGLTVISDIRSGRTKPAFMIDMPEGMQHGSLDPNKSLFLCEFVGADKLKYRFKTLALDISEQGVWLQLPEVIHRIQKREDFRLEYPRATQLIFSFKDVRQRMGVVNFSRGGALAELSIPSGASSPHPLPKLDDVAEDVELVFQTMQGEKVRLAISKMVIRHVEHLLGNKKVRYGVQFVEMKDDQRRLLTRLIVRFQREYLRNRLRLAPPES